MLSRKTMLPALAQDSADDTSRLERVNEWLQQDLDSCQLFAEKHTLLDSNQPKKKDRVLSSARQRRQTLRLNSKLEAAEVRAAEAERAVNLAETHTEEIIQAERLKQQQYLAANQVLAKEVEQLKRERLGLRKCIQCVIKDKETSNYEVIDLLREYCSGLYQELRGKENTNPFLGTLEELLQTLQRDPVEIKKKLNTVLGKSDEGPSDGAPLLKVAYQTVKNLQNQLKQKESVLQKYQNQLTEVIQDQDKLIHSHQEELRLVHQRLEAPPHFVGPVAQKLMRLAELEAIVREQDLSLSGLKEKQKLSAAELEEQKVAMKTQVRKHVDTVSKLQSNHAVQAEVLHNQISQMETKMSNLHVELRAQREAADHSPSSSMKKHVEQLKKQLAQKDKQVKALSKALLDLKTEMLSAAQQQVIASIESKEESKRTFDDRHTKDLKGQIQELTEKLKAATNSVKAAKGREATAKQEADVLKIDLHTSKNNQRRLQAEKNAMVQEIQKLKQKLTFITRCHSNVV